MTTLRSSILSSAILVALAAAPAARAADGPPPAPREFRAAWIATVNNIDWPSKRGLTTEQQKAEILAIVDRAAELRLNCLIVQVRPACDALYPSKLEPWSAYLTGVAGQAPSPFYDPLQTWIDECHRRGIELHAWFNPYRALLDGTVGIAPTHISKTDPGVVLKYVDKLWLDPGEPTAAQHSVEVFNDVTRRYDVDGIHIDDYFYPYPEEDKKTKKDIPFPDDASWNRYKRSHPVRANPAATNPAQADDIARADWRRSNVNQFVERIYTTTKQIKPWVKFGISPFGIGRKGKVAGVSGMDQYDDLFADAALWLRNGWCDYFTPQLYWSIAATQQSFPKLNDYWHTENAKGRHIWPGLFTVQVLNPKKKKENAPLSAAEIRDQIAITRKDPDAGHVHYSISALIGDKAGIAPTLMRDVYQTDALVPASPWLDNDPPPKPTASIDRHDGAVLSLTPGRGEKTWRWAIWRRLSGGAWSFQTAPGDWRALTLDASTTEVVVTAVDRCGNESPRVDAK